MLHLLYSQNGHFGRELFAVFWVNVVDEDFTRRRGRRLKRVENRRPKNVVDSLSFVNVVDEDFTRRRGRRLKRFENRHPKNVVDSFVNVANVDPCTESSCSSSELDPLAMDESSCYDFEDNTAAELPHSDTTMEKEDSTASSTSEEPQQLLQLLLPPPLQQYSTDHNSMDSSTSALDTDPESTADASTSAMNKCTVEAGEDSTLAAPIDQATDQCAESSSLAVDARRFYGFTKEDCRAAKPLFIGKNILKKAGRNKWRDSTLQERLERALDDAELLYPDSMEQLMDTAIDSGTADSSNTDSMNAWEEEKEEEELLEAEEEEDGWWEEEREEEEDGWWEEEEEDEQEMLEKKKNWVQILGEITQKAKCSTTK
jgi:hypothetical protein